MPEKRGYIIALAEEVGNITEINGAPVQFCGVGKINATIGALELINKGVNHIVNLGSCGSRQHRVGEIIQVGKVYQDIDCTPICDYGHTAFEEDSSVIALHTESPYTCFTTDYFYEMDHQDKYSPDYLRMIESSSIFDMELFGIAKACKRFHIRLNAYKWVSDDGNFSDWQKNCEIAFHKVLHVLENNLSAHSIFKF